MPEKVVIGVLFGLVAIVVACLVCQLFLNARLAGALTGVREACDRMASGADQDRRNGLQALAQLTARAESQDKEQDVLGGVVGTIANQLEHVVRSLEDRGRTELEVNRLVASKDSEIRFLRLTPLVGG